MFLERHFKNSIKQLQNISETNRVRTGSLVIYKYRVAPLGAKPTTCQWIDGDPPKGAYRKHGTDPFKCTSTAIPGKSWCEFHHRKVFQKS